MLPARIPLADTRTEYRSMNLTGDLQERANHVLPLCYGVLESAPVGDRLVCCLETDAHQ